MEDLDPPRHVSRNLDREGEDGDEVETASFVSILSALTTSTSPHCCDCHRRKSRAPRSSLSSYSPIQATCDTYKENCRNTMGVLMFIGIAAIATSLYNFSIMQRVEIKSLETALQKNLYCQEAATEALIGHLRSYTERQQEGVVLLFLSGAEGSGKTLTLDTLRYVNPKWKKIVGTHEEGDLNRLSHEELIATIRSGLHASTLNILFFDDIPDLAEGTPFVETKLRPVLRAFKFEKALLFIVVTSQGGNTSLPEFLTNEYEHQTIIYKAMTRSCVEKCAVDVLKALGVNQADVHMKALMSRFRFDVEDGVRVSRDGCKTVHKTVALFLSERAIPRVRVSK